MLSTVPAIIGLQYEVWFNPCAEVHANQNIEMGKPHTVTSESKKRDSGRIIPPFFWRSRFTSQVCNGKKKMNIIVTLDINADQTAMALVEVSCKRYPVPTLKKVR